MNTLRLLILLSLSSFLINGYCVPADKQPASTVVTDTADTLGDLIQKHLIGYWVQIRDVRESPIWLGNISAVRYAQHWTYICGAGKDYVVLCSPSGMFYSAIPTADIRLGGLYSDPRVSVDLCKTSFHCAPSR